MYKYILLLGLGVQAFFFTGCATPAKMPLLNQPGSLSASSEPVYLMTVTFKNSSHPRYQPKLLMTYIEKPGAEAKADRLNFSVDSLSRDETDTLEAGNRYYVRLQLPPRDFVLMGFGVMSSKFPFNAMGIAPILEPLPAKPGGVYYLGHINATVRERVGGEFRAGPVVPLLDQSMTGFSGGTFDVVIEDRWASDEALFRIKFPALSGVEVKKNLLPPFNRPRAQTWWENL